MIDSIHCLGKVYEIVTVGAPVCHTLKFGQGGLKKLMSTLKRAQQRYKSVLLLLSLIHHALASF